MSGNFRVESVAVLPWNGWQLSCGISGKFTVEWVATFAWNTHTREFWAKYQQSSYFKTAYGAVFNRLGDFLTPPLSVVFSTHTLSWKDILARPSIVFLDLSRLGGDPLATAGQLLIAAIQTTLYERIQLPESQRLPYYYMYIDEFAKFVGAEASFRELFGRIRKCNVGLTVAHQTREDLRDNLEGAIVGNVKTMIIMQVSAQDAPFYARELQLSDIDEKTYRRAYSLHQSNLSYRKRTEWQDRYAANPELYTYSSEEIAQKQNEVTRIKDHEERELDRLARQDARGAINPSILQNLQRGQAIVRLEADGFSHGVAVSIPRFTQKSHHDNSRLIDQSRKRYGRRVGDDRNERVDDDGPSNDSIPDGMDDFLQ